MTEHTITQRSDEWHALRRGRITASRAACLMTGKRGGYLAERSRYIATLAAERVGVQMPDQYVTRAMEAGIAREPEARRLMAFMLECEIREVGFITTDFAPWCGFSPDGMTDDQRVIEIKCPEPVAFVEFSTGGELPSEYLAQVQFGLWITGLQHAVVGYYHPEFPRPLVMRDVERDANYIDRLAEEVTKANEEVEKIVKILRG